MAGINYDRLYSTRANSAARGFGLLPPPPMPERPIAVPFTNSGFPARQAQQLLDSIMMDNIPLALSLIASPGIDLEAKYNGVMVPAAAGATALIIAAVGGHVEVVKALLEKKS